MNSVYVFYEFLARRGVGMGAQLERHRPARPGDHAGFLAGIAERSVRERPTRLKEKKRRPETLSDAEVQQILDACDRLRDRLLMSVMFETGCRIGQALGMLRRRTSIDFHPHLFRHSHATALLRAGVRLEVVSELLTHVSVQTTADTHAHLDADDLAGELARAGFWTAR